MAGKAGAPGTGGSAAGSGGNGGSTQPDAGPTNGTQDGFVSNNESGCNCAVVPSDAGNGVMKLALLAVAAVLAGLRRRRS
jgi:MYXO-CTERM domain-containing protein